MPGRFVSCCLIGECEVIMDIIMFKDHFHRINETVALVYSIRLNFSYNCGFRLILLRC